MYYSNKYSLLPGDRLIEAIFKTGITKHHSIYVGMDSHGTEWVAENFKFTGVRLVKASEFFNEATCYDVKKFLGNMSQRKESIKRALIPLGHPYDLIWYNCEHYASYVQTGKSESRQVLYGVIICIIFFLIIIFNKRS